MTTFYGGKQIAKKNNNNKAKQFGEKQDTNCIETKEKPSKEIITNNFFSRFLLRTKEM